MRTLAHCLLITITLSGCAAAPTKEELARANFGSYPTDCEQVIRGYMDGVLKDSESARYQFLNKPQTAWTTWGGKRQYGYAVCAYINAKNSFGGYVGNRLNYFMIHDGKVIAATHGDGEYGEAMAEGRCKPFIGG